MSRARNVATAQQVARVLRGALEELRPEMANSTDGPTLCENNQAVLLDLLRLTPRPTASVVREGAKLAFSVDAAVAHLYGERIAYAISYCRTKRREMTTGKKLPPAVREVIEAIVAADARSPVPPTAPTLWRGCRELKRRLSDEAGGSAEPRRRVASEEVSIVSAMLDLQFQLEAKAKLDAALAVKAQEVQVSAERLASFLSELRGVVTTADMLTTKDDCVGLPEKGQGLLDQALAHQDGSRAMIKRMKMFL